MEFRVKLKNFIKRKWGDVCRRSHYVLMGLPFVLVTAGLVLSTASVIRIHQVLDGQPFQYAAELFESKSMPYRQLTVLGPGLTTDDGSAPRKSSKGLDVEKVQQIHEALDVTEQSAIGSGKSSSKAAKIVNVWKDCYSASARYPAKGFLEKDETGSVDSCEIMGVSEDYAILHPFCYESGGFLPDEDGDRYTIVLNTQLAWNLFHSYQVLGAFVEVNGISYQVVGVVNEGKDDIAETTGVTEPRAYVQFPQLASLINGPTTASSSDEVDTLVHDTDLAVTCYEVLLMDPIKNIAYNDVVQAMGDTIGYSEDKSELQVFSNTSRFHVTSLWKKYFPLKKSYTGGESLQIPYYERSARLAEQYVVFWAEFLVVGIVLVIGGGGYIYAIFHGKETRHKREEDSEDEHEISYL